MLAPAAPRERRRPGPTPGRSRPRWPAALGALLFALVFCHELSDRLFGIFPDVPTVSDKLAVFAARRDEFDTVFVGSSRVYNHLSPKIFDDERAAAGRPGRAFNLGVSAMRPPESFQMLDRALALRPARLRVAVLELVNVYPRLEPRERDTRRATAWHRPREAAWILLATLLHPDWANKSRWFYDHALASARAFFHVGDAHDRLFDAAGPPRAVGSEGLGMDGDGYAPTTAAAKAEDPEHRRFLADLPAYGRAVAAMTDPPPPAERDPVNLLLRWDLPRRVAQLRARGIETVLFIPPVAERQDGLRALAARCPGATLLAFNDPARYPELYRPEIRVDAGHLDADGAEILTRLLARRLLAGEARGGER